LIDQTSGPQSVLRELGDDYTYSAFMTRLEECKKDMNPAQRAGLKQRLDLLQSFTRTTDKPTSSYLYRSTKVMKEEERFAAGMVTIVDLSDPFIDSALAGAIFEICVRLFQKARVDTGKVLVVDEAHKVLLPTPTLLQYRRTCWLTGNAVPFRKEYIQCPHAGVVITSSPAATHVNARDSEHARFVLDFDRARSLYQSIS
jgi:hypothetical protein